MSRSLWQFLRLAVAAAALCDALLPQTMLVDRGLPPGGQDPVTAPPLRTVSAPAGNSIGDDFTVGAAGEVWMLDKLRTWVLADTAPGPLFEKLTLYGGIAGQPLTQEQAQCACHSTVAIKNAGASGSADVSVAPAAYQPTPAYQEQGKTFRLWGCG